MTYSTSLLQQQQNILIDLTLFTLYSIILTILCGIWCRTIFFSSNAKSKRKRRRKSKTRLTKSSTNMTSHHITTSNHKQSKSMITTPKLTPSLSPRLNVSSPKLLSPRLSDINFTMNNKHCVSPPISLHQHQATDTIPDIKLTVPIHPEHTNAINIFVHAFKNDNNTNNKSNDSLPSLPKLQILNTNSLTNNLGKAQKSSTEEEDDEDEEEEGKIIQSASMAFHGNHRMDPLSINRKHTDSKRESVISPSPSPSSSSSASSKNVKLEPTLVVFGTASIFFAVLYSYLNAIELFLMYNNNKYFSNELLNICHIWSVTLTPMFFNRLCIYLYLTFRIYFVFNSSIYGISTMFICVITAIVIIVFVLCYTFFNVYITLIATQCTVYSINLALMPSRYFDFILNIVLISLFIFKLNKLVKRCLFNGNKTNQFIEKVKYLINKLLILLIVSISGSFGSYVFYMIYQQHHVNDDNYFALQSILRFDIIINTICLILSLTAFDTFYQYLCFPFRIVCESSKNKRFSV